MNWDEEEKQIKQEKQVFSTSLTDEDSEDIIYIPRDKRSWKRQRELAHYEYDSSSFEEDEESLHNTCFNYIPVVCESQLSSSHCPLYTGTIQPLPPAFQRTLPDCYLEDCDNHCYCNECVSSICYEDEWPEMLSSSSSPPSPNSYQCGCAECQSYQYFKWYDSTPCRCYHCRTHSPPKEPCLCCYCQYEHTGFPPPTKKTRK